MESLKQIASISWQLLIIVVAIALIVTIIMGVIDTIAIKIKTAKDKKELEKNIDILCEEIIKEIEKEEAKETKKVSKTKKSK